MIFNHLYQKGKMKGNGIVVSAVPNFPVTLFGYGKVAAFSPAHPIYTWGCVYDSVNNKFYYGVMSINPVLLRDPIIVKFDPVTNRIEQEYRIPIQFSAFNADSHRIPNMAVDTDGHLYVVGEQLHATEGHGSSILLYKTSSAGNIATLTLIKTLTGRWAYPNIVVSGTNVFISARGSTNTTNFIRGQQWYFNSTDSGANFGAAVQLYASGDEDKVSYMWMQYDYNGGISFVLNERDNVLGNWTFISFIKGTFNSNVWTNADASFSKNVSSSGAITRAQMISDCLVVQSTDFNTIAVNHEGGCTKSDGSIRVVVSIQTLTGNDFEGNPETSMDALRVYYFASGSWSFAPVTIPTAWTFFWAYTRYFLYFNDDQDRDDILFIDPTSNNNVNIIRSTNNFASQSTTLVLVGNTRYRLGNISYNSTDKRLLVLIDTLGDMFEIQAETVLDFSNILALQ